MGVESKIQWTHATFNPHWGCAKVSPGCKNCYAETFSKRTGFKVWGQDGERREFGDKHWTEPLKWNVDAERAGERRRVFCASMADVFEDHPVAARSRDRLWPLIAQTPWLDWLLLTKRPENIKAMLPESVDRKNIWLGTTAESQEELDRRMLPLILNKAAVLFLSMEPLLGHVDLRQPFQRGLDGTEWEDFAASRATYAEMVQWVIVGGESGPGARPFDIAWARSIVRQCREAGTACFVKQVGARPVLTEAVMEEWPAHVAFTGDGVGTNRGRVILRDKKGGDPSEWPEDLRVREFPEGRR